MRTSTVAVVVMAGSAAAQSSSNPSAAPRPTVSLFLPMGNPGAVEASVISADASQTVYALGCPTYINRADCTFNPSVTVTEGPATLIYTATPRGAQTTGTGSNTDSPATVFCSLGGTTAAVCTGKSSIAGLGIGTSISTLSAGEITFIPVAVTAGQAALASASTAAPAAASASTTSSSTGAAPTVTGAVRWLVGGLAGAVAFGAM